MLNANRPTTQRYRQTLGNTGDQLEPYRDPNSWIPGLASGSQGTTVLRNLGFTMPFGSDLYDH